MHMKALRQQPRPGSLSPSPPCSSAFSPSLPDLHVFSGYIVVGSAAAAAARNNMHPTCTKEDFILFEVKGACKRASLSLLPPPSTSTRVFRLIAESDFRDVVLSGRRDSEGRGGGEGERSERGALSERGRAREGTRPDLDWHSARSYSVVDNSKLLKAHVPTSKICLLLLLNLLQSTTDLR